MKKEDLIPIIAQHNPLLANAVDKMTDYIQEIGRASCRERV